MKSSGLGSAGGSFLRLLGFFSGSPCSTSGRVVWGATCFDDLEYFGADSTVLARLAGLGLDASESRSLSSLS